MIKLEKKIFVAKRQLFLTVAPPPPPPIHLYKLNASNLVP